MNRSSTNRRIILVAASLLIATLACSAPAAQSGTATPTFNIAQVLTITPVTSGQGPTQAVTLPSGSTNPTPTTASPGVPPTATTCLYNSIYVSDLTIPDGTEIKVGDPFTKSWRIKNNGCQVWPSGTMLIFVSGNQMSGPASVPVPETALNGTQDVSVNLKAPSPAGEYQGYWQLRTPSGVQFGDKVYVQIKSINPTAPTATPEPPTGVDFTASYVGGVWSCTSGSLTLYRYTAIVKNTGTVDLESSSVTLQSPPGTVLNSGSNNTPFQTVPSGVDCNAANMLGDKLTVGSTGWVSMHATSLIPNGSSVRLVVKLCSEEDQGGDCKTVRVNFTVS